MTGNKTNVYITSYLHYHTLLRLQHFITLATVEDELRRNKMSGCKHTEDHVGYFFVFLGGSTFSSLSCIQNITATFSLVLHNS